MKGCISETAVANVKWDKLLEKWNYKAQSAKTKKRWRQIFLYGMALHTATDAFAHSSYFKDPATGKILRFYSKSDPRRDDRTSYPNRWKCAKYVAYMNTINCDWRIIGDVSDFSAYGESYWKGFYMGNILKYAIAANGGEDVDFMEELFKKVNYDIP